MFKLDLILNKSLPSWIINKDIGGLFLHVSRTENDKNVYFFDQILAVLICCLLLYF